MMALNLQLITPQQPKIALGANQTAQALPLWELTHCAFRSLKGKHLKIEIGYSHPKLITAAYTHRPQNLPTASWKIPYIEAQEYYRFVNIFFPSNAFHADVTIYTLNLDRYVWAWYSAILKMPTFSPTEPSVMFEFEMLRIIP